MYFDVMQKKFNQIKYNKLVRQTGLYSLMQVFSLGMGFLINVFLAKEMGVELFGIYSFAAGVMGFVGIFFEFGFFSTAAKILADNQDPEKEHCWLGAFFLIFMLVNMAMTGTIFLLSLGVDYVFEDKIGVLLSSVCIYSYVYIVPFFMELVLKGNNKIYALSGFNFFQRLLSLMILFALYLVDHVNPQTMFHVLGFSYLISFLFIYFSMKPKFDHPIEHIRKVIAYNKEYGWPLYWGRISTSGAYNLDKLLIPYFIDARAVGLYTLAYSFAAPIVTLSNALAAATFRDLAKKTFIAKTIIRNNVRGLVVLSFIVLLAGYLVLCLYLPEGYHVSFYYLVILVVAFSFQGAYTLYNSWLAARGHTQLMRNIAFRISVLDVFSNAILIMCFGAYGGCMAALLEKIYAYYLFKKAYHKFCIVE